MTTVVAIIRPKQLDLVKDALADLGVQGMTGHEYQDKTKQRRNDRFRPGESNHDYHL